MTALSMADPLLKKLVFLGKVFDSVGVSSLLAIFDLVLMTERGD